ncbi:hypothetical protein PIROE2DRAFT_59734 [Piromyces sp. E2]|nr:hypothetical protein PIROE2DRAFT_59734 [Piromyces sp. E2]|eukprot:OUM65889.1 hypothetical protein PIROE2DRAFT_59734 [Piromyces sp. E2]
MNKPNEFYEMKIDDDDSFDRSSATKVNNTVNPPSELSHNLDIDINDTDNDVDRHQDTSDNNNDNHDNNTDIDDEDTCNSTSLENNDLEHIVVQNTAMVETKNIFKTYSVYKNVVRVNGFKLLRELNFQGDLQEKIKNLDPVEQNKIKVVIALMKNKRILFMEEPTSGMTEDDRTRFWKVMTSRKNNRSIIVSTESLEEASLYATSLLYMEKGKCLAVGEKEQVLEILKEKKENEND